MSVAGVRERMEQRIREELGNQERKKVVLARMSGKSFALDEMCRYAESVQYHRQMERAIADGLEMCYMKLIAMKHRVEGELMRLQQMGFVAHAVEEYDAAGNVVRIGIVIDDIPEKMKQIAKEWERNERK